VGNTRHSELDDTPLLTYRSVLDNPGALLGWPMTLIARTDGDPTQTLSSLRDIVRRLDPELPVTNAGTFNDRLARVTMPQRMGLVLLSGLGVVALLVATIGVYAAVSYSLAQRRREIGIRVALGATPSRVTGLVVRLGVTPALIGIAAGLLITLFTTRLLQSFLFGITPTDPPTLIATAGLILAVAAGASILPARRGARTDPVQALRDE
jgi:ABC-type antimicrobial peptide transport system permease subunit